VIPDSQPNKDFAFTRCPRFPYPFPRLEGSRADGECSVSRLGGKSAGEFKPLDVGIFISVESNAC